MIWLTLVIVNILLSRGALTCPLNQKSIDINNLKNIESDKKNTDEPPLLQMLNFIILNSPPFACSKDKEGVGQGIECELMAFISDKLKIPFTYKIFESSQHDTLLQNMNEAKWNELKYVPNSKIFIENIRKRILSFSISETAA